MASGLQCPGCGHVHPSGLPEIARGDATFRCYGCYRTLSIPEGWTGPTPRAFSAPVPTVDAPPGAGTRDARTARLAGRRGVRIGADGSGEPTQMVPMADGGAGASPAPNWPAAGATGGWAVAAGTASGTAAPGATAAPLGWVAPRRSGQPVPAAIRALVWAAAFGAGLFISAFLLKKSGLIGVNTAIDLFAGSGPRRFGFLVVMLPLWALLSATIAHLSLEALARRRRPRPTPQRSRSETSTPG